MSHEFWEYLQHLVDSSEIVIDRSKGSIHPRYPEIRYPVDYGFLKGTTAIDGGEVDIWVGSTGERKVVGAVGTVDLLKRDTELKILYDCTENEIESIHQFLNSAQMRSILIKRD